MCPCPQIFSQSIVLPVTHLLIQSLSQLATRSPRPAVNLATQSVSQLNQSHSHSVSHHSVTRQANTVTPLPANQLLIHSLNLFILYLYITRQSDSLLFFFVYLDSHLSFLRFIHTENHVLSHVTKRFQSYQCLLMDRTEDKQPDSQNKGLTGKNN